MTYMREILPIRRHNGHMIRNVAVVVLVGPRVVVAGTLVVVVLVVGWAVVVVGASAVVVVVGGCARVVVVVSGGAHVPELQASQQLAAVPIHALPPFGALQAASRGLMQHLV